MTYHPKFLWIILLSFICMGKMGHAQNTFQVWTDYDVKRKLSGNWLYFNDYGFRFSSTADKGYWRIHTRPSIEYRPRILYSYRGGIGLFYQTTNSSIYTLEIRPWQGFKLNWPNYKRLKVYNYARLEQRIVDQLDEDGFSFSMKLRYKIGANIPLNNPTISVGTFYIPINFEVFANLALINQELTSDRNRTTIGIGYRYTKNTRIKMVYTFQAKKNNVDNIDRQKDHIIHLTLSQQFGLD